MKELPKYHIVSDRRFWIVAALVSEVDTAESVSLFASSTTFPTDLMNEHQPENMSVHRA